MTRIPAERAASASPAVRASRASFSLATMSTTAVWKSMTSNAEVRGSMVNWFMAFSS
jgi:hypothetical protein